MGTGEAPRLHTWPDLDAQPALGDAEFLPAALHLVMAPPQPPSDTDGLSLHTEAREVLEQARSQADHIRQQVREEEAERARALVDEALRESRDEQVAAFQQAAEGVLAQMRASIDEQLADLEQRSASLVTAMAEKVIGRQLEADDEVVLEVVRSALAEAAGAAQVTLSVNPSDDELVRAAQAELIGALGTVEQLRIVADEGISRGGCIVETERGRFDARIETQLELLGEHVERLLKAS